MLSLFSQDTGISLLHRMPRFNKQFNGQARVLQNMLYVDKFPECRIVFQPGS